MPTMLSDSDDETAHTLNMPTVAKKANVFVMTVPQMEKCLPFRLPETMICRFRKFRTFANNGALRTAGIGNLPERALAAHGTVFIMIQAA